MRNIVSTINVDFLSLSMSLSFVLFWMWMVIPRAVKLCMRFRLTRNIWQQKISRLLLPAWRWIFGPRMASYLTWILGFQPKNIPPTSSAPKELLIPLKTFKKVMPKELMIPIKKFNNLCLKNWWYQIILGQSLWCQKPFVYEVFVVK